MKQYITKEQWDELSGKQRDIFLGLGKDEMLFAPDNYINIGKMIEFLGNDLEYIRNNIHTWETYLYNGMFYKGDELIDALWLAVKEKLNK